jgi:hypothetical protein
MTASSVTPKTAGIDADVERGREGRLAEPDGMRVPRARDEQVDDKQHRDQAERGRPAGQREVKPRADR